MRTFKRPNSSFFWYQFDVDGVRHRGSTKRIDKKSADRVLAQVYQEVMNANQFGDRPTITLEEACDRVLMTVSGKTHTSYLLCKKKLLALDQFKGKCWGLRADMVLHHLSERHLDDLKFHRQREGLRPNSINVELRFLKRVHNFCHRKFRINEDLQFSMLPSFVRTRIIREPEQLEIEAVFRQNAGSPGYDKAYNLYLLLLHTGVRFGEAIALDWSNINLTTGRVEVYRDKTSTLDRVPLPTILVDNLKKRHNEPKPFMNMGRAIKILRKVIDETCNKDSETVRRRGAATIHSLRDTYITWLEGKGVSLRKIGKLVGHSSIETSKKYAHLHSADIEEEVRTLFD